MSGATNRPREHLIAMIIGTVVYGAALPFVGAAALFSPMASDSGLSIGIWIFIVSMFTLPFAIVAALILGWIFFAARLPRLMWVAILFPLLWLIPLGFTFFTS